MAMDHYLVHVLEISFQMVLLHCLKVFFSNLINSVKGRWASVGAMVGATLPVVPPMVCMFTKTPLVGRVKYIVGCSSLVFLAAAFTMGRVLKIDNEENN